MDIEQILGKMTLAEKAALCSGKDFWKTKPVERLGVPAVMMSDGPHGLRKQAGEGDHLGINESIKAVCFPASCALASSFDEELAEKVGSTLGNECQAENLAMILGPGVNIKRSPLGGRDFEYYSEDPYLAGKMGTAMVKGIQSQGTAACIKHFAANNQETCRMSGNSQVDERTLHEIYLTPFEMIVKEARPRSVMCAYNQVNGTFCSENKLLLTDILRDKWGFDGFVVTDWGAVQDPVNGIQAGLDLVMPGGNDSYAEKIIEAVKKGELEETQLDQTVMNILKMVDWAIVNRKETAVFDREADYKAAEQAAEECAVLLKNDKGLLPLAKDKKIAFIGEFAAAPRYQGSGSSHINSTKVSNALEAAKGLQVSYAQGFGLKDTGLDEQLLQEAVKAAAQADVAVLFAGLPDAFETEGADRETMELPENQNRLIEAVAAVQPNTVVVLHNGSPVTMPWLERVPSVLEMYLGGDGVGEAAVRLLFGDVNPSGKLAETFPKKVSDNPSYLNFPGRMGYVTYHEGVFVGYRYYDKKEMEVQFPFGYGLSYTSFSYSDLKFSKNEIEAQESLIVEVTVTNTGKRFGKEAVQLYIRDIQSSECRPVRELKGFAKVALQPGESRKVFFTLDKRSFAYYEPKLHDFMVESGEFAVEIGASSRDIRLSEIVKVNSADFIPVVFTRNTTMGEVMGHPKGQALMAAMREKRKDAGSETAAMGEGSSVMVQRMMTEMPLGSLISFAGLKEEQVDQMIAMLNKE